MPIMGLPLRPAAGYRTWSQSNAANREYVTALKVTDAATDAPQTARAGKKLTEWVRVLPASTTPSPRRSARLLKLKLLHLCYPSSVMNCLYVAFDVSSAYRYPNASRNASNFWSSSFDEEACNPTKTRPKSWP